MTLNSGKNETLRRSFASLAAIAGALGFLGIAQCTEPQVVEVPDPEAPVAVIAELGEAGFIELGETVTLDGSGSYIGDHVPEGTVIEGYFWEIEARPSESLLVDESLAAVTEGDNSVVEFAPDVEGLYGLTLQVSDGTRVSDYDQVVVQVGGTNACPIADAGPDTIAQTGTAATLDGTASVDGDDDELQYVWEFSLVPSGSSLTNGDIYNQGGAPHIIPDVPGTYILSLRVTDGACTSLPDYVTVQATNGNSAPVADAGQGIFLTPCAASEVQLDGTASYDPEGRTLGYEWGFTSVPSGSGVTDALIRS